MLTTSNSSISTTELLMTQLTLACRHVHRVLTTLNSSLRRVLCCTVFININALNTLTLGRKWNSWSEVQSCVQRLIEDNFEVCCDKNDEDSSSEVESVDSRAEVKCFSLYSMIMMFISIDS